MDDLLGEDWQKPADAKSNNAATIANPSFASNISGLRVSPALSPARSVSPQNISRPSSTLNGTNKPPGGDAFGNLLGSKSQKASGSNLTIQERQKQLLEEKRRQQEQQAQMWDSLATGRSTPEVRRPSPAPSRSAQEEEDDIMAAFNKDAPVDKASHFPPPNSGHASGRNTPAHKTTPAPAPVTNEGFDDDDDPFGLSSLPKQTNGHAAAPTAKAEDDAEDILGDLGKPVTEKPAKAPRHPSPQREEPLGTEEVTDSALAELIDMGFPADNAKIALAENEGEVQGAVSWLLQQAHEESKQKSRAEAGERRQSPPAESRSHQRRPREQEPVPQWMRQEGRAGSGSRQSDNRSPGEKDPAQVAQEYGTKFLKGATSLWKASQKQMAKTMAEFQQDRDPAQPKWMQEVSADPSRSSSRKRPEVPRASKQKEIDVTDEAAMLDAPRERPSKPTRPVAADMAAPSPVRDRSPANAVRPAQQPRFMQQAPPLVDKRPSAKLSRQDVEEQSAQAYISPARRKKPAAQPQPETKPQPEPEVDLFSPAPSKPSPSPAVQAKPASRPTPSPTPVRPTAPARNVPSISPSALSSSATHRKKGGESFKRGDYASAHESYTAALGPLPPTHPLTIIVLSNRSLTALKTGDAKMAVSDADQALSLIGPSQGVGESIDLGAGEGLKDMREFYGKALMRKAEALEHMEKWSDAAAVWRDAISAGVGGAVCLRGRDRCEKAAAPKPAPKPASAPKPKPAARPPPTRSNAPAKSTEAVQKLRAQNAAADKADDERFALTDQVDARLSAWRGGKTDNLRALLQSLDQVLWESAGWKKVGMSDLVMPNKVKIIYMKAIAKVHPDKIAQDATTEQRMISGAVFSTLNEAWDKFKRDNNL